MDLTFADAVVFAAFLNVMNERGREEMRKLLNYVNNCLRNFKEERGVELMEDMNGNVRNKEVAWC